MRLNIISITRTTVQVNPDALRRLLAKLAEDEEAAYARRAARAAQEQRRKLEELAGREERGAGGPGGGFAGPDGSGQWVRRAPAPCPVPWCPDSSVLELLCSVYSFPRPRSRMPVIVRCVLLQACCTAAGGRGMQKRLAAKPF